MSLGSEMAVPPGDGHPAASGADATYSRVAELPVRIEQCELRPLARDTSSGFTKVSIVVRLTGNGHEGQGEDITWDQIDQIEQLRRAGDLSWLRGRRTVEEFSTLLGLADLFPVEPIRDSARFYRRWAFESAALDLALRQNRLSLQDAVGRVAKPVTFVVSIRLGDPANLAPLRALRKMDPSLHFKLDPTASWDDDVLAELASLAGVDVVDMKGHYLNATVAIDPDPDLYRRVFERLPGAWIEDPAVADHTIELLDRHRNQITWDEPIRSVGDIEALPWPPRMLNRHRRVRRGHVRAGSGTWAAPVPGFAVPSRWSERPRPRGVQPAASGGRPSALAAPTGATPDRFPLGKLRRAPQHPRATARAAIGSSGTRATPLS